MQQTGNIVGGPRSVYGGAATSVYGSAWAWRPKLYGVVQALTVYGSVPAPWCTPSGVHRCLLLGVRRRGCTSVYGVGTGRCTAWCTDGVVQRLVPYGLVFIILMVVVGSVPVGVVVESWLAQAHHQLSHFQRPLHDCLRVWEVLAELPKPNHSCTEV